MPGRPINLGEVGQGPIVLEVGTDGGVWAFLLLSIFSFSLSGKRPDID